MDLVRKRVLEGMPYLGVSAGANVACPSMMTTNDMPICLPPSFESFGLVPFQINPHYHPGRILFRDGDSISEHFGETRSKRIEEYHRTIVDPGPRHVGGFLRPLGRIQGEAHRRATAFRSDGDPVEMDDGTMFDGGLVPREP